MSKKPLFLLLMLIASLVLAACGGKEDPTVAFCDALTEMTSTSPTIAALGEAADLAQIVQLGNAMDTNWQTLRQSAKGLDTTVQTAFAPYDESYTSIPAITQEMAMAVARATLDSKNQIAIDSYGELFAANCQ